MAIHSVRCLRPAPAAALLFGLGLVGPAPVSALPGFPCTVFGSAGGLDGVLGTADDPQVASLCGTGTAAVEIRDGGGRLVGLDAAGSSFRQWPSPQDVTADVRIRAATAASDLRTAPGTIEIETATGQIIAVARVRFAPQPRDPATGAPSTPAPGSPAPSQPLVDALCDATRGFSALDRNQCVIDLFNSQRMLPSGTVASSLSVLLGGGAFPNAFFANTIYTGLVGTTAFPLNLAIGASDGPGIVGGGIAATLTTAQESLVGCGAGFGTSCDSNGLSIRRAAPWALFQSFGSSPANDGNVPQPGTTGAPAPPGTIFPGSRGPGDPGYDPAVDGSAAGLVHPLTGQAFRSELAALSWNFQNLLVAFTGNDGDALLEANEFAPASKLRTDGCSFVLAEPCDGVRNLRRLAVSPLGDDPTGGPPVQWLWEIGAEYEITAATGDLCRYAGGTVLASGPYDDAGGTGLAVLALPAAGGDVDCDGVPEATDNCPHVANADQSDLGGIGTGSAADGIGDACQCGDVSGDGRVTLADAVTIQRALLQPPTAILSEPALCDANGDGRCTLADAVVTRRSLLNPPAATIQQGCLPANP